VTAPATAAPWRVLDAVQHFQAGQEGWRRRIAASWRLPPLDCGHRDPLDCPRPEPAAGVGYCCARLGIDQAAELAALGRRCSETTCAVAASC